MTENYLQALHNLDVLLFDFLAYEVSPSWPGSRRNSSIFDFEFNPQMELNLLLQE